MAKLDEKVLRVPTIWNLIDCSPIEGLIQPELIHKKV